MTSRQLAGAGSRPPLDRVGSSFTDFLGRTAPDLLPGRRPIPQLPVGDLAPHGTTIVASPSTAASSWPATAAPPWAT